mmetsp:Transcript_29790/g.102969  ORF Transcript_29790/g.102969 Transcript_29790/m.102969 type:complete len:232 (+) Transcript_29790:38-733(+)
MALLAAAARAIRRPPASRAWERLRPDTHARRRASTHAPQAEAPPTESARDWAHQALQLIQFGAVLHCLHEYVLEVTMCCGPSMLPTCSEAGDVVIMERFTPRFGRVKVGDVVIAKSPTNAQQTVCKRVAAVAGEPIPPAFGAAASKAVVPKGCVWLLGDNTGNSNDSRYYGAVPEALVKGRVIVRVWPPEKFGALPPRPEHDSQDARDAHEAAPVAALEAAPEAAAGRAAA